MVNGILSNVIDMVGPEYILLRTVRIIDPLWYDSLNLHGFMPCNNYDFCNPRIFFIVAAVFLSVIKLPSNRQYLMVSYRIEKQVYCDTKLIKAQIKKRQHTMRVHLPVYVT